MRGGCASPVSRSVGSVTDRWTAKLAIPGLFCTAANVWLRVRQVLSKRTTTVAHLAIPPAQLAVVRKPTIASLAITRLTRNSTELASRNARRAFGPGTRLLEPDRPEWWIECSSACHARQVVRTALWERMALDWFAAAVSMISTGSWTHPAKSASIHRPTIALKVRNLLNLKLLIQILKLFCDNRWISCGWKVFSLPRLLRTMQRAVQFSVRPVHSEPDNVRRILFIRKGRRVRRLSSKHFCRDGHGRWPTTDPLLSAVSPCLCSLRWTWSMHRMSGKPSLARRPMSSRLPWWVWRKFP